MFHYFLFGKQLQKGDNDDSKITTKRIKNIYLEENFKDKKGHIICTFQMNFMVKGQLTWKFHKKMDVHY